MNEAYKKLDISNLPADPEHRARIFLAEIERQNKAIFDLQMNLEETRGSLIAADKRFHDERIENGVLDGIIDKLIDKLAR